MLRKFMDMGVSLSIQSQIADMFEGKTEEEKESLAQKVVKVMETASKESDIIGMLKETL